MNSTRKCSCVYCKEEFSSKGIHTHYLRTHSNEGSKLFSNSGSNSFTEESRRKIRENLKRYNDRKRDKEINEYEVYCYKCEKKIIIFEKQSRIKERYFCSRKCANSRSLSKKQREELSRKLNLYHNNGKETKSNLICPISGEEIIDKEDYKKNEWSIYPSGRIRTIRLLAETFDIKLGNKDAPANLSVAKEKLREAYEKDKLSGKEIKKKFNIKCSNAHVLNFLKALGINRRTLSEAGKLAVESGRAELPVNPKFKNGYHVDWRGKKHYYRSSYELEFIKSLDSNKVEYEMESVRIRYYDSTLETNRIAIPDVLVDNTIYEIKSEYTFDRQNMIDKYKSYIRHGYNLFIVLEHKEHCITHIEDINNI